MAVSTIDKELLKYYMQLDDSQKRSLLQLIKTFLKTNNNKLSTVEQYNRELDIAMKNVNNGQFTTMEELEKEMQSW